MDPFVSDKRLPDSSLFVAFFVFVLANSPDTKLDSPFLSDKVVTGMGLHHTTVSQEALLETNMQLKRRAF